MKGFDTGHKDCNGLPFVVGCQVEWFDSETFPCNGEVIVLDGCMIGVESHEGFVLAKDLNNEGFCVTVVEEVD